MYKHNKKKLVPGKLYSIKLNNCLFRSIDSIIYIEQPSNLLETVLLAKQNANIKRLISNLLNHNISVNETDKIPATYLSGKTCDKCNNIPTKLNRCHCYHLFLFQKNTITIYDYKNIYTWPKGYEKHYLANQLACL